MQHGMGAAPSNIKPGVAAEKIFQTSFDGCMAPLRLPLAVVLPPGSRHRLRSLTCPWTVYTQHCERFVMHSANKWTECDRLVAEAVRNHVFSLARAGDANFVVVGSAGKPLAHVTFRFLVEQRVMSISATVFVDTDVKQEAVIAVVVAFACRFKHPPQRIAVDCGHLQARVAGAMACLRPRYNFDGVNQLWCLDGTQGKETDA